MRVVPSARPPQVGWMPMLTVSKLLVVVWLCWLKVGTPLPSLSLYLPHSLSPLSLCPSLFLYPHYLSISLYLSLSLPISLYLSPPLCVCVSVLQAF